MTKVLLSYFHIFSTLIQLFNSMLKNLKLLKQFRICFSYSTVSLQFRVSEDNLSPSISNPIASYPSCPIRPTGPRRKETRSSFDGGSVEMNCTTSITYLLPELGYSRVRNEINEFTFSLAPIARPCPVQSRRLLD